MNTLHANDTSPMTTIHISSKQATACGAACGMAWLDASRRRIERVKPSAPAAPVIAGNSRHSGGAANVPFALAF
jgi:hypothetical protein